MDKKGGKRAPELRFKGFTDDWEQRKLGELMDVTSVKRIRKSDWKDSGIRFLRARDIVSASKNEEPADYLYISEEKYYEYSKISGKVSQGDLLVTGVGSIGVPMLITDDEPLYFKDGNIIWFKNEHKIEGNFFYYSFINNKIQKYIHDVAGIGTVGTYTIDSGKKTPISLSSYDEQVIIGAFLNKLDKTINLHQRKLEKLKELKKSYLYNLLPNNGHVRPNIRFSSFSNKWEECKLGDISTSYSGGTPSASNKTYYGGEIPFIRSAEINSSNTELYLTKLGYDNSSAKMIKVGDILYALYGATSGEVGISKIDGAINQAILAIKPETGYDSEFIMQWLYVKKSRILSTYLQGGQGNLSGSIVKGLCIKFPSYEEQHRIGNILRGIDKIITFQEHRIDNLNSLKKIYLQKLFV